MLRKMDLNDTWGVYKTETGAYLTRSFRSIYWKSDSFHSTILTNETIFRGEITKSLYDLMQYILSISRIDDNGNYLIFKSRSNK